MLLMKLYGVSHLSINGIPACGKAKAHRLKFYRYFEGDIIECLSCNQVVEGERMPANKVWNYPIYSEYIKSDQWKCKADETKRLAGYRCQVCNSDENLHAHHRTYERLGKELQSDLICLCSKCHSLFHNGGQVIEEAVRCVENAIKFVYHYYGDQKEALADMETSTWRIFVKDKKHTQS